MFSVSGIMEEIWEWIIGSWINLIWLDLFTMVNNIVRGGEMIFSISINICTGFLVNTPQGTFPDSWQMMKDIAENETIRGLSEDIVIVAFLISLIDYCITVRTRIELEDLIKMFGRMCIGNYLVFNYVSIIEGIWTVTAQLVTVIVPETDVNLLEDSSLVLPGFDLFWIIIALVYAVVMIVLGFKIITSFFERFLWAFIAVPFGGPAFATIVGSGHINQTVRAYIKYIIATALEFVAFAILIKLLSSMSGNFLSMILEWINESGASDNAFITIAAVYLSNICFAGMTAGMVGKLDVQVTKMLAL